MAEYKIQMNRYVSSSDTYDKLYPLGENDYSPAKTYANGECCFHNGEIWENYSGSSVINVEPVAGSTTWRVVYLTVTDQEPSAPATIDADTLEGHPASYFAQTTQLSNQNLLDNPWFTVNQRGQNSYNSGYSVDRWANIHNEVTVSVTDNGIGFSHSSSFIEFVQLIEPAKWHIFIGKTVTASFMLSDGNIYSGSAVVTSNIDKDVASGGGIRLNLYKDENGNLQIRMIGDDDVALRAVKLELGSVSTLANDTAPNYADELAKCQRYFYRLNPNNTQWDCIGMAYGTQGYAVCETFLPCPLRAVPSISCPDLSTININPVSGTSKHPNSIGVDAYGGGCALSIKFTANTSISNEFYWVQFNENATYIDLSADL